MYICFEGVMDAEAVLRAVLPITDCDVVCAPRIIGIRVPEGYDASCILENTSVQVLEDTPGGFWAADLVDDEYFLDRVESSLHRRPNKTK